MSLLSQATSDRIAALFTRGNALAAKGNYEEALRSYDKILKIAPGILEVINNRGNCLAMLGRYEQAIGVYNTILSARPNDIRAFTNRANAFKALGRHSDALRDYDRVLSIDPNYMDALFNRGNSLTDLGRASEAIESYRRALAHHPHNADIHVAIASALLDLRRPRDAVASYRRALMLKPRDPTICSDLIFALNFDPEATTATLQAERRTWGSQYDNLSVADHTNDPDPDRRLRVGYVSAHFRSQAATYAFGGVITHHDREKFDVICYSDMGVEDDVSHHLRRQTRTWRHTLGLPDDRLAALIRNDRIDILVDLVGHMKGNRLGVFAQKPAPVQVTAWGEPTGTGLKAIDYIFADPVIIPMSERSLLTEEVADLPNFIGFWSPESLPEPQLPPALTRGYVTFGSFNRLVKVLPETLGAWAAILRAVPRSKLVLKVRLRDKSCQSEPLMAVLADEGIAPDRVTILDQGSRAIHFAAYNDIDIALDPFPHSGGMTTLDALWMGVPVLTCPGRTISSRLTAACLTATGLGTFIAADLAGYIELGKAKAGDLDTLAELRTTLRSRIAASNFGNPQKYARAVEAHYRSMWQRWCSRPKFLSG